MRALFSLIEEELVVEMRGGGGEELEKEQEYS